MSYHVTILQSDLSDTDIEEEIFANANYDYDISTPDPTTESELIESAKKSDALMLQYREMNEAVISSLPNLKIISRYGIGVDCIDIDAANDCNVAVTNVPSYCEEEVATHTISMILNSIRKLSTYDVEVKNGCWDWKKNRPIKKVSETTLGFMGFGKIPRKILELVAGFDFNCITYDPYIQENVISTYPVERVSWNELLTQSDIISIHSPLNSETENKFDVKAFKSMKSQAVIINTARGGIVNEQKLGEAIKRGEIAGAGIDVMSTEPPQSSPLKQIESVTITPHMAWYSESSLDNLRRRTAENIISFFEGDYPHGFVNEDYISV